MDRPEDGNFLHQGNEDNEGSRKLKAEPIHSLTRISNHGFIRFNLSDLWESEIKSKSKKRGEGALRCYPALSTVIQRYAALSTVRLTNC